MSEQIMYVDTDGYGTEEELKIRPPSKQQIVEWVEDAWYETTEEVVVK